jgi:hypothetical protein
LEAKYKAATLRVRREDLPPVILVGGKKKSGKDFVCDTLVTHHGYSKIHIVTPWLIDWCQRNGIDYVHEYLVDKGRYRAKLQADALEAREANPHVLTEALVARVNELRAEGHPVAVTGVRFINECLWGIQRGHFVLKIETPDEVRRQRFINSGENLALFDDPFEREIDEMPAHLVLQGNLEPWKYPQLISAAFRYLLGLGRIGTREEEVVQ